MLLAFYKASRGNLWDRAIALWTRGDYCHVELAFDKAVLNVLSPRPPVLLHDHIGDASLCFSSASNDHGTRFKWINLADGKWDLVTIDCTWSQEIACARLACCLLNRAYDWAGVFRYVLPNYPDDVDDLYCSEAVTKVLEGGLGMWPGMDAKISPNMLYKLVNN